MLQAPYLLRRRVIAPPRLVGVDNSPSSSKSTAYIRFGASRLYKARFSTLIVFDLALNQIGSITDATNLNSAVDVELSDNETFAFVAAETGAAGACVSSYNVANPASISFVQRMQGPTPGTSLSGASSIKKDSAANLLFVPCITRNSVAILSFNPLTGGMTWVAEYRGQVPGTSMRSCRRCALDTVNRVCFWACDNNANGTMRMGAFSYADPANPVELWSGAPLEADGARGIYWNPERRLLFVVANGPSPFYGVLSAHEVLDTTSARFPRQVGAYVAAGKSANNFRETMGGCRSVAFKQVGSRHYALVTAESGFNIVIIDVTDPTRMYRAGLRWDTALLNAPMDIQFGPDGYLYTGNFTNAGAQMITKWDVDLAT